MQSIYPVRCRFSLGLTILASLWATPSLRAQKPIEALRPEQTLVLTLLASGFEQAEYTTAAGLTNISIRNYSFAPNVTLRLDRQGGARLRSAAVERLKPVWRDTVELTPGEYVLSVAEVPDWKVRISVEGKRSR